MSAVTSQQQYKRITAAVEAHWQEQGWDFGKQEAKLLESWLLDRVESLANHLGIAPTSVLLSYDDAFQTEDIAKMLHEVFVDWNAKISETKAVTVTRHQGGRLIASLGRVAHIAAQNPSAFRTHASREEAFSIMGLAADAISMLGLVIADAKDDLESITIPGETAFRAEEAIRLVIDKLQDNKWTAGAPHLTKAVPLGMAQDIACLQVTS